ncbi:MAG: hypothetical protein JWN56_2614 [Sphingobacteriales bacterium]|nr:hypothetical protein [Sphingobacteriales bacterium]
MDIESLREYCLAKPGAIEALPFGDETLVFKVCDKIFLLTSLKGSGSFNVKCDPEKAMTLREEFTEVQPGYHMNKKHWNTVSMKGKLTTHQLKEMIDHSFALIFNSLPKSKQQSLS